MVPVSKCTVRNFVWAIFFSHCQGSTFQKLCQGPNTFHIYLVIHAVREPIQDSSPDLVRQHRIKLVQLLTALHTRQLYVHPPEDEHIPQKQRRQFRTDFPDDGVFRIGRLVIVIAKPKRGAKKVHTPILLGRALHR